MRPVLDSLLKLILPHEAVMTIDGFILWLSELTSALGMQETIGGDPLAARDFTAFRKLKEALASIRKSLKLLGNSSFSGIELFSLIDNLIQNTSYRYQYYPDDAVKVGKPFDMRESSMRAVFIAGLNEGEFPPAASLSLIDGREKRRINSLASKVIFQEEELRSMTDRLDFEVAVSRCREFLYLSRTPFDESGREILPSIFLQSVAPEETLSGGDEIFEIVPSSSWMEIFDLGILVSHDLNLMDESVQREILRENPLIATNARLMRNYFDIIGAVNRAYRSGKSPADKTGLEYFGICGDKSAWIKEKAEKMVFSGSRLETFGNCRFNFLLRYIIGIHGEEYPSQKIKSTLKGSFYHAVLKDYISEAGEKVPDYEILDSCIERNFREFVNMEGEKGLFTMEKGVYRAFLREFIEFDAQCLRDYSPAFTEEPLDDVLDTGEGLFMPLTGSIDRIDSAGADGPLRIIDYKTGNTGHFKKDYLIPLKLFQGFIYAWSVKKHVSEISFVSIEKKGRERKTDILPFIRGKHAVLNFHEIWNEKVYEIKTIFALIGKGDFSPVTLESDYEETVLEFYRAFHDDPEESIEVESPGKCTFCVYKLACPREDKLISRP
ncbi:MAG: PD-(D/E)XK nuclease family protein [Brevinematales bacterium]